MSEAYVVGYDPGGNGKHGVAALRVEPWGGAWMPVGLEVGTARYLRDAVDWVAATCRGARIVAAGIDTLTEWHSGRSGFRPADLWLRETYPAVANSVVAPAALYGAMGINGAAFLTMLGDRFRADATLVTEAHPKVCYHAVTGRSPGWAEAREEMVGWLSAELDLPPPAEVAEDAEHRFDAATAAPAALRGRNGEWTLDLHAIPGADPYGRIRFFAQTHYWWPAAPHPG